MRISDWSSDVCSSDLTVADITPDHALSRITIVTNGPPPVIDQIIAQLDRLVPVHKVTDLTDAGMAHVEREIAMVKVAGTGDKRSEALRMYRPEERRAGKEGVSKDRYRGAPDNKKKNNK